MSIQDCLLEIVTNVDSHVPILCSSAYDMTGCADISMPTGQVLLEHHSTNQAAYAAALAVLEVFKEETLLE